MNISDPTPAGLDAIARRRFRQVGLALESVEDQFAELEEQRSELERRAARLRREREALLDTIDRGKGGRR